MDYSIRKRGKKAEVPAQIMTYVLAAILFGLIMVFGYNVVVSMRMSSESVAMVKFKTQLEGDIKKMSMETGRTTRLYEYLSPGNFREVCFIDSDYLEGELTPDQKDNLDDSDCRDKQMLIDSADAGVQSNMFLFPGTVNFEIGSIEVDNGCVCITSRAGKFSMRMKGKGDRAEISPEVTN